MPRRTGFRKSLKELLDAKASMLTEGRIPIGYSTFDNGPAIMEELTDPREDKRIARLFIVWDQPFSNLDEVDQVLEQMRAYGAAMVERVEEVK